MSHFPAATETLGTLHTAPLAPLLTRLFAQAEENSPRNAEALADLSDDELERQMRSKTGYIDFYTRLKDFPLAVSPETGQLLYMLARSMRAQNVVEFGTSFGVSTLHLAAALRDNGGGRLISCEFEPSKIERAQRNLSEARLLDLVELRAGDALQTLSADLPAAIDLVLLDGAKALYPEILALLEDRLRPGAFVVADNADHSPAYLARVRSSNAGYMSIPVGADVELSMRLG
ncbi:O-methyltransferase [Chitinasiproducens palmae]|uniref:Predicted O-methyltransferase YrrM n=1 Tax=Chitinasiproducens palmae TaxID=1770053 RepID=A0A1H2PVW4_9BURK|nr:O-methyltransferase [Chitinasiproducens palmae]SDV50616.1 Predicted O-methyltransferase YrrM [Chitinasiproducens palmae]